MCLILELRTFERTSLDKRIAQPIVRLIVKHALNLKMTMCYSKHVEYDTSMRRSTS